MGSLGERARTDLAYCDQVAGQTAQARRLTTLSASDPRQICTITLALRGIPLSIAAGAGFIALSGVAVLNGL